MNNKYQEGEQVFHACSSEPMVILKVLKKRWFRKRQKYVVTWFNKITGEYINGRAFEIELRK